MGRHFLGENLINEQDSEKQKLAIEFAFKF